MKKTILFCLMLFSSGASAGVCGKGKVVAILEGGLDTDDYMIQIDYSVLESEYPGTEINGFIVFKSTLSSSRLKGIRALALSAMMSGKIVKANTHTADCSQAISLKIES